MKKTLFLFGATMLLLTTFTSCTTQDDTPAKPKNYYGTEPEGNGTPKEAYYAFSVGVVCLLLFLFWFLKKLRKK